MESFQYINNLPTECVYKEIWQIILNSTYIVPLKKKVGFDMI